MQAELLALKHALMGVGMRAAFELALLKRRWLCRWHYLWLSSAAKREVQRERARRAAEFAELQADMANADRRNREEKEAWEARQKLLRGD